MKLGEVLFYEQPTKYIVESEFYNDNYKTPVLTAGKSFILGYTNETNGIYDNLPCIIFDDFTTDIKYVDFPFKVKSSAMKILTTNNKNDLRYLYHFLSTIKLDTELHKRYWISICAELNVNLPLLSDQECIAAELGQVCDAITKQKKQLKLCDDLIKSKFNELFINDQFKKVKIGCTFEVQSGGTPSTQIQEYWKNGTINWIGSNLCQDCIITETDRKFITSLGLQKSSAKLFGKEWVLVALVGATIGKTALLKIETTTNQNIAGINIPKNKEFTSEFVYYALQNIYNKFMEIGGDKFKMANLSFIRNLEIAKPPLELQQQFADFVNQVEQNKTKIKQGLNETETLYKALMQKYFGGEHAE